jgi:hypothetical protein
MEHRRDSDLVPDDSPRDLFAGVTLFSISLLLMTGGAGPVRFSIACTLSGFGTAVLYTMQGAIAYLTY